MKRLISIFFFLSMSVFVSAQTLFKVDERFELTGIAARLAGYQEYTMCKISGYAEAADEYFAPYKEHGFIHFLQQIRQSDGIAYDALPKATHTLQIVDNKVITNPAADIAALCKADPRWTEDNYRKFAELSDRFYKDTDFHAFFESNSEYYRKGEDWVNGFCDIDTSWFNSFYGKSFGSPELYLSLVNGPANYALADRGILPGYGILAGLTVDPDKEIMFGKDYIFMSTVVHELCHNFTNSLCEEYRSRLVKAADRIFNEDDVRAAMIRSAYGDPWIMTVEWLNNLCEAMYFREKGLLYPEDYGFARRPQATSNDYEVMWLAQEKGFFWMTTSIEYMDKFYENRDKYKTIEDFMPEIVEFYNRLSRNIDKERERFAARYPEVVEFSIDSTDKDTLMLSFRFSHPMSTWMHGVDLNPDPEVNPLFTYPEQWKYTDEYTLTARIDRDLLEKGKRYGGALNADFIRTLKSYQMKEDYPFEFVYE